MGFSVPQFPLDVNIWRNATPHSSPPDVRAKGNLAWGRRVNEGRAAGGEEGVFVMTLLLPHNTDIRSHVTASGNDTLEVPAGTGRFYDVVDVDDIGKGFPNEHRAAVISQGGNWPAPIP